MIKCHIIGELKILSDFPGKSCTLQLPQLPVQHNTKQNSATGTLCVRHKARRPRLGDGAGSRCFCAFSRVYSSAVDSLHRPVASGRDNLPVLQLRVWDLGQQGGHPHLLVLNLRSIRVPWPGLCQCTDSLNCTFEFHPCR